MPATGTTGRHHPLVSWFFRNFFRLLLMAISASEWFVATWILEPWLRLPLPVLLLGPVIVYYVNFALTVRVPHSGATRHPTDRMPRAYYATAFTSLFGAAFLLLHGTFWGLARLAAGLLPSTAGALTTVLPVPSSLDGLARASGLLGLVTIGAIFTWGYTRGQQQLVVRRIPLRLRHTPAALAGLRIAQVSDIHIGRNLTEAELRRFVRSVNEVDADLVCITGDIVDNIKSDLDLFVPLLGELRARHGVYAILGNHDHYAGADRVAEALRRMTPFTVLRDETASVTVGGARLHLIGMDDRGPDWARGYEHIPQLDGLHDGLPADEPVILLCHRPDTFRQAVRRGVDLTLSGHTHGGQMGILWFGGRHRNLAEFITPFDRGLYEEGGSFLYVNCGLGVTGQRIRLWTPREISVFEVEAGSDALAA